MLGPWEGEEFKAGLELTRAVLCAMGGAGKPFFGAQGSSSPELPSSGAWPQSWGEEAGGSPDPQVTQEVT